MGTFKSERFVSLSRNLSGKVAVETLDMPIICHSLEEHVLEYPIFTLRIIEFWQVVSVKFLASNINDLRFLSSLGKLGVRVDWSFRLNETLQVELKDLGHHHLVMIHFPFRP